MSQTEDRLNRIREAEGESLLIIQQVPCPMYYPKKEILIPAGSKFVGDVLVYTKNSCFGPIEYKVEFKPGTISDQQKESIIKAAKDSGLIKIKLL